VRVRPAAWALVMSLAAGAAASAHHSAAATYAADETIAIRGRVAGFAWTNPHCHAYIEVVHGAFKGRTYTVELGSPAALTTDGWTRTTLRPGDEVVMSVHPSRASTPNGLCRRCALTINGAPWRGAAPVE
jgi:hypothetical protein